jgi:hypothetical protein
LCLILDRDCEKCAEFNKTGESASLRQIGVELDVTLFYSNLWFSWADPWTWLLPADDATFEVLVAARQPLEGVRTIRTVGSSELLNDIPPGVKHRVTRRSYGVRLIFHQRGIIGKLDTSSFISFVLQSLTFLTIAWTLCELLCDATPTVCSLAGHDIPSWYNFLMSQSATLRNCTRTECHDPRASTQLASHHKEVHKESKQS